MTFSYWTMRVLLLLLSYWCRLIKAQNLGVSSILVIDKILWLIWVLKSQVSTIMASSLELKMTMLTLHLMTMIMIRTRTLTARESTHQSMKS